MPRRPVTTSAASKRPRQAQDGRPSLLVLHLDANKLRADGLHLGDATSIAASVASLCCGARVEEVDAVSIEALLHRLGDLAEQGRTFDVVVAIGHSNEEGICIAPGPGGFISWAAFGAYLKPFRPRRLLLAACQAARWPAAQVLFSKLPALRRIFGSPVNASKDFATLMVGLIPYVLAVKAPSRRPRQLAQVAAALLTGGQLREWKRDADKDAGDGILLDVAAQLLDPHVRSLPDWVAGFVRSRSRG